MGGEAFLKVLEEEHRDRHAVQSDQENENPNTIIVGFYQHNEFSHPERKSRSRTEKGRGGNGPGSERDNHGDACFHQGHTEINRSIAFGGHLQRGESDIRSILQ